MTSFFCLFTYGYVNQAGLPLAANDCSVYKGLNLLFCKLWETDEMQMWPCASVPHCEALSADCLTIIALRCGPDSWGATALPCMSAGGVSTGKVSGYIGEFSLGGSTAPAEALEILPR